MRLRLFWALAALASLAAAQNTSTVYRSARRPRALAIIGDRYHSPVYIRDNLAPAFVRTHRGAAVALAAVQAVRPRGNGDAVVVLHGGTEVPCSRQHRAALVQELQRLPR